MKLVHRNEKEVGASPGTLVHVGEKMRDSIRITVIDYDERHFEERDVSSPQQCYTFRDTPTVTWINVYGLHKIENIEQLGSHFGLHRLVQEDILNTRQRPKVEDYEEYVFIVLKMLSHDGGIEHEQVSLVLGQNFVLSFQEQEGDMFEPVRNRIRVGKRVIRTTGPDYLAYALLDAVVDGYFLVLEKLGDTIESLSDTLILDPKPESIEQIYELKTQTMSLRRVIWPMREVVGKLQREEIPLVTKPTLVYLRDVHDHAVQVIDTLDSLNELVAGMHDVYLSSMGHRMNEVMKTLTIIATIFIPLTFVAGIYGMNFDFMPELQWKWGYFMTLAVMLGVGFVMILYFRRKKWL